MSQIGSLFRKKCLGGKLKVAMGDSVSEPLEKKRFCGAGWGCLPASPALGGWNPLSPADGGLGFVWQYRMHVCGLGA